MMDKNAYEKLFDAFLDLTEFTLVKYFDGWGLKDNQNGNLGNIEQDRFDNAIALIDRLDAYIVDYLIDPIENCLGIEPISTTWGAFAEKHKGNAGESEADVLMLDALCNHPEAIRLENCKHEVWSEKIYTVICRCYSEGTSAVSFHRLEDARDFVRLDSGGVEDELKKQGRNPEKAYRFDYTEVYVPDTDIYYEWNIEESELY